MINYQVAFIPGDGVGPELTGATLKVLDAVQEKFNIKVSVEKSSKGGEYLRNNLSRLAVERKFVPSLDTFYTLVHDVSTAMVRINIKAASGKRCLIMSQAVFI